MLWKKESSRPDALYTDIFASHGIDRLEQWLKSLETDQTWPQKSDEIAQQKRTDGNEKFRARVWIDALEAYSDSLRFANPESELISLAYANRAAVFLTLKMYNECLTDIELAEASGYPEHLMPKLQQRKSKCLNEMEKNPQYKREELSIEPDEKFPYVSKTMAKVQQNGKGEFSVVAKTDIDVGQPIVVESALYTYLWDRFGTRCNICLKEYGNLVPCKKCATAMFCFGCQDHFLHDHECGLYFSGKISLNAAVMPIIRDILLILKAFPNINELIAFVEQIQKKPNNLPDNLLDDRSKFQVIFSKSFRFTFDSIEKVAMALYSVYKTIFRIPQVNKMFSTTKHRRFLQHLIGHQVSILDICEGNKKRTCSASFEHTAFRVRSTMEPFFQHSCCPNVFQLTCDGKIVWHSIKPIKKGEKLFVAWFSDDQIKLMQEGKPAEFKQQTSKCQCSRCKGKTLSSEQREQLTSDPAYRFIQSNKELVKVDAFKSLLDACVTVLQRYGQWNWCEEIQYVIGVFHDYHYYALAGPTAEINHPFSLALLSKHKGLL